VTPAYRSNFGNRSEIPRLDSVGPSAQTRVLLVDGDQDVREVVTRALRMAQIATVAVATADEAHNELNLGEFDALVADIALPGAANGLDLARRARRQFPSLPVLYLSSATDWGQIAAPVYDPVTRFLQKPVGTRAIVAELLDMLAPAHRL
jgi:two-component system phosphate regulon response regulator OmpR